jgi:urease accessory protein
VITVPAAMPFDPHLSLLGDNLRMNPPFAPPSTEPLGWQAHLELTFARRGARSLLLHNRHKGPLRVQKALYPEGETVCQAILLHPPSGIVGGDVLRIEAVLQAHAHAQLTTPGAGKWYRTQGPAAYQHTRLEVGPSAILEYLPQETLFFEGAHAHITHHVQLEADSAYLGWDVLCLGRAASGERFDHGGVHLDTRIERAGMPLWVERGFFAGEDPLLKSPVGWNGATVCATLACSFPGLSTQAAALLEALRLIHPEDDALHGLTCLPDLLLARYLGHASQAARHWFAALWAVLRPALCGRPAVFPRIWNT